MGTMTLKNILKINKKKMMFKGQQFMRIACKPTKIDKPNNYSFFIRGKIAQLDGDYDLAIKYYAISCCSSSTTRNKVMSLRALAGICSLNKQYLILTKLSKLHLRYRT